MTVTTQYIPDSYIGDGSIVTFSYTFDIAATTDIEIFVDSVLIDPSAYTIDDIAKTVTFNTAPANLSNVLLTRDTPLTQETDYIVGDSFPADSHEAGLDKLTLMAQERNQEIIGFLPLDGSKPMTGNLTV